MSNNLTLEDIDNLYLWYTRLEGNELGSKEEILDIDYIEAKNSLPKELFKLNNLKSLSIEVEDLTKIPKEIVNLSISNLINLYIIGCHNLKEIPKEIGNLNNLGNCLSIKDCPNLKEMPKEIGNLGNLERLEIYNCPNLKEFPKEYWNKEKNRNNRKLQSLLKTEII